MELVVIAELVVHPSFHKLADAVEVVRSKIVDVNASLCAVAHCGNFDTYFDGNEEIKKILLMA